MTYRLLAIGLLLCSAGAWADYAAAPKRAIDLSGAWKLNAAQSEDPERMLQERLDAERERYMRRRQEYEASRPPEVPPPIDIDAPPPTRTPGPRPWQKQQQENFRRMLGLTQTLHIDQRAATVEIVSDVETRRITAGSRTQVSMPEGQLADSTAGWDGEWFVIERKVRRGPRVIEKFRLLKNGQLEYLMAWSGDTELAGIKARRLFDRSTAPVSAPNPDGGPVR